ncbi:MAG: choice-of-anchor U domain-containing protein [Pseudomonadota bacterium]|nr:choice-of-anchor U domain-containing protein [Pseudomonadota bacterium]
MQDVTDDNLADINQQVGVDEQSLTTVNAIRTLTGSINTIRAYAEGNSLDAPTVDDYQVAGVQDVTDDNLADINQQVGVDKQSLTTVNDIRTLTSSVNTIRAYAEGNSLDAPTVDDYQIAGVQDVTDDNLADINQQVGVDEQSLSTVNEIRTLTDSINTIRAYAEGNSLDAPTVDDYQAAGVQDVTDDNLADINQQVGVDKQSLTTVNDIRTLTGSVNTIRSYAEGNSLDAPTESDYRNIGITDVTTNNIDDVNDQVSAQSLLNITEIENLTTSLNIVAGYVVDKNAKEPTERDYENIGILSVDSANVEYVNEAVGDSGIPARSVIDDIVSDVVFELSRTGVEIASDLDGDGIRNEWDDDIDGDGVLNKNDIAPLDPTIAYDIDGDGVADEVSEINLTIVEVNNRDKIEVQRNGMYKFIPVTLSNGSMITDASVFMGTLSIVDNAMLFTAPDILPQQLYIEYEVTYLDGSIENEYLLLSNTTPVDEGTPRFENVEPEFIQATGLFTPIRRLSPKAVDALGNPVPVSLISNQPRLRSGNNIVYWEANDDKTGRKQTTAQLIQINPQVEFGQGKFIYEDTKVTLNIYLSGYAPVYPVTVPVLIDQTISTTDEEDYSLSDITNVVINSGLEGSVTFDLFGDTLFEGEETLKLDLGRDVNLGVKDTLTLIVKETTPMPTIKAGVIDDEGGNISIINEGSDEDLYLTAFVENSNSPLMVSWSHTSTLDGNTPLGTISSDENLLLNNILPLGRHRFSAKAVSLDGDFSIDTYVEVRVIETIRLSADQDSDNDGIPDLVEGLKDSDGDLIPDYIDAVNGCELQAIDNDRVQSGGFVIQSTSGSCIKLGKLSELNNTYSPYVNADEALVDTDIPVDVDYEVEFNNSTLSNFVVTNVFDESVTVVLPLMQPYNRGGVFRKYNEERGWFDFDTSEEGSNIRYAKGDLGFCPSPGSNLYQEEPILGANCLEISIKDGGVHDSDGERNGVIDDPGYMAYMELPIQLEDIVVEVLTEAQTSEDFIEVGFDLCLYILLENCNINVLSVENNLFLDSRISDSWVYLEVPFGNGEYNGRIILENSEKSISYVHFNLLVTEMIPESENTDSLRVNSSGQIGLYFWLLLMVAFYARLYPFNLKMQA